MMMVEEPASSRGALAHRRRWIICDMLMSQNAIGQHDAYGQSMSVFD